MSQFIDVDFLPIPDSISLLAELFPADQIPNYNKDLTIHHVILHLPKEVSDDRATYVENWLGKSGRENNKVFQKIKAALAEKDFNKKDGYTWPDRGFRSEKSFLALAKSSLVKNGVAVMACKQTFEAAARLQRRLTNSFCSFKTSLLVLPFRNISGLMPFCRPEPANNRDYRSMKIRELKEAIAARSLICIGMSERDDLVQLLVENDTANPGSDHGEMMSSGSKGYTKCSSCACVYAVESHLYSNRGAVAYSCTTCNKELCLLCCYTKFTVADSLVLVGELAGSHIRYPPQDNSEEVDSPDVPFDLSSTQRSGGGRAQNIAVSSIEDLRREFKRLNIPLTEEMERKFRDGDFSGVQVEVNGLTNDVVSVKELNATKPGGVNPVPLSLPSGNASSRPQVSTGIRMQMPGSGEVMDFSSVEELKAELAKRNIFWTPEMQQGLDNGGLQVSVDARTNAVAGVSELNSGAQVPYAPTAAAAPAPAAPSVKNSKPKTKQSVIDALKRSDFDSKEHDGLQTCVICFGPFTNGDSMITLPCGHFFHGDGRISDECNDCLLITTQLKLLNECPICQYQLEAEDTHPKASPSLKQEKESWRWQCPLCDSKNSNDYCFKCHYKESAYRVSQEGFFDDVEKLFLKITELRLSLKKVHDASTSSAGGQVTTFDEESALAIFGALKPSELKLLITQRKLLSTGMSEKKELVKVLLDDARIHKIAPRAVIDDGKISSMHAEIDKLLNSSTYEFYVQTAHWDIQSIKLILERNLNNHLGDDASDYVVGIDSNSSALIRILIKRLIKKNSEKFPHDHASLVLPVVDNPLQWVCSLCSFSNTLNLSISGGIDTSSSCVHCQAGYGPSRMKKDKDYQVLYTKACDLAARCFDLTLKVASNAMEEGETSATRSQLKLDINEFLEGQSFNDCHEKRGFFAKRHLRVFFSRLLKYEFSYSFEAEAFMDMNSVACYANFIHNFINMVDANPAFKGKFNIEKPNSEHFHNSDNSFENFSEQIHKLPSNSIVAKQLENHKELFITTAKLLAYGGSDILWNQIETFISICNDRMNIKIELAVRAMRAGVRDLATLTHGFDPASKFIINALHSKVSSLELLSSFVQMDDIISIQSPRSSRESSAAAGEDDIPPLLKRQNSIGTDVRSALSNLKDNLEFSPEDFKSTIIYLFKVAVNIQQNPKNYQRRHLNKDFEKFKKLIAPSTECMSVLSFMGFVDHPSDTTHLYLPDHALKIDAIARIVHVLKEIGKAEKIEFYP